MEGGQKIDINLESPLDTKSSDMLVSINDIKFAHNRQRYQGHVLPTSLRYERDGWAAGWYVYNFSISGGVIFSRNQSAVGNAPEAGWLTATRTKITNTPTYVFEIHAANKGNIGTEEDPVVQQDAYQFKAWYNSIATLDAPGVYEASILNSDSQSVTFRFNYRVGNIDYVSDIAYSASLSNNEIINGIGYSNDNLTLQIEDTAEQDGLVHGILFNNKVSWQALPTVYVPKDILMSDDESDGIFAYVANVDSDGYVHYDIKCLGITNGLTFKESVGYTSNSESITIDTTTDNIQAKIQYQGYFDAVVPAEKIYVKFNNITWGAQGNSILFSKEHDSTNPNPMNKYYMSFDNIIEHDIDIYTGELAAYGFDGPDVSVLSKAEIDLIGQPDTGFTKEIRYNTAYAASVSTAQLGTNFAIPILSLHTPSFRLPGDTENREVDIQVYFKYTGDKVYVGQLDGRDCYMYAVSYPFANMYAYACSAIDTQYGNEASITRLREPLYVNRQRIESISAQYMSQYMTTQAKTDFKNANKVSYNIDGKDIDPNLSYAGPSLTNSNIDTDVPYIAKRDIAGRVVQFSASLTGVNGVSYSGNEAVNFNLKGINTNLIFTRYVEANLWQQYNGQAINSWDDRDRVQSYINWDPIYFGNNKRDYLSANGYVNYTLASETVTNPNTGTQTTNYNVRKREKATSIIVVDGRQVENPVVGRDYGYYCDPDYIKILQFKYQYYTSYYLCLRVTHKQVYAGGGNYNDVTATGLLFFEIGGPADSWSNCYFAGNNYGLGFTNILITPHTWDSNINLVYFEGYDTVGNYITEGLSSGLPVVSSSNGKVGDGSLDSYGYYSTFRCSFIIKGPNKSSIVFRDNSTGTQLSIRKLISFGSENFSYADLAISSTSLFSDITRFKWENNALYVQLSNNNVYWYNCERTDYWIGEYNSGMDINVSQLLSYDVVDSKTGEVLIDHTKDTLTMTASLYIHFGADNMVKGYVYYPSHILDNDADVTENISNVRKLGNIGNAFFPICNYTDRVGSIYSDGGWGASQGIAVFDVFNIANMPNGYYMQMLSPLCKYVLPPKIKNDKLVIYAKRAFTHHINWNQQKVITGTNPFYYITDKLVDTSKIDVVARTDIFDNVSSNLEYNNIYYTTKTLLKVSAISYYDEKIHITYGPTPGNNIDINGTVYDLSTSEMSIVQTADLRSVVIPVGIESFNTWSNKYKLLFSLPNANATTFKTKEVKEILQHINNSNDYYFKFNVNSIEYNNNNDTFTVNAIYNVSGALLSEDTAYTVQADSLSGNKFVSEYTSASQLYIRTVKDIVSTINLPGVNQHKVYNQITEDGDILIEGGVATRAWYNYKTNKVTAMHINGQSVTKAEIQLLDTISSGVYDTYNLKIDQVLNTDVYFKYKGIYKVLGNKFGNIQVNVASLTYNNNIFSFSLAPVLSANRMGRVATYPFNFNDFEDPQLCTPKYLDYSATDVRDDNENTQTKYFARVKCDNEYQLVKQQWDSTVETEDFWWVDKDHILKLTKDKFVLMAKLNELDDWNGDKWEVVKAYSRKDYLNSEADIMICSSASGNNSHAYLYIFEPVNDTSLLVKVYDPLDDMSMVSYTVNFKHIELGKQLSLPMYENNTFTVKSYSNILANTLLVDSKITAVEIDNVHWVGIQYDKNYNQWSFKLNSGGQCIPGYGCIGINGYATGGMLPKKIFNTAIIVQPISSLEAEGDKTIGTLNEFNKFNERIVGDENQQWYISEKVESIVLSVNLRDFSTIDLPITNKYTQVYSSPSYAKYTVHAIGLQVKQLMDLFTTEQIPVWQEVIRYAMYPTVWFLSPYTNVINYLQQTLGQYAYVHYNTTSIGKRKSITSDDQTLDNAGLTEDESTQHIDALTMDDLSFDVQHISQEQSFRDNAWNNILGIFMSMVISATDYAIGSLTVNSLQNQTAVSDIGRKFSQAFSQNIGSMSVTGFNMQSTKPMLKSEVTAVKTLDMFYSTSAEQRCFAGPGIVNMQFVAQCTAQSVTSVQLEAQQTQVFILLKELSTWQAKVEIYLVDLLVDKLLSAQADQQASGPQFGIANAMGFLISIVLQGSAYALELAKAMLRLSTELVSSMLDSFFPGGIKSNVTATLSRHNYDIEGKHAYGNKSETFFWPCIDCKAKTYYDETVEAVLQEKPWPLEMPQTTTGNTETNKIYDNQPACVTVKPEALTSDKWEVKVDYNIASCKGTVYRQTLPDGLAYVVGTESFLPTVPFKNENIGEGEPVFTPPPVQDYLLDKNWNLMITAMGGDTLWISCKDTKLFDGNYSNVIVQDDFCGIACSHVAIEIKQNIQEEYLRPWAVTPDAIALNITGLNCAYEEKAYHAFDGYGYRVTDWLGSSGMNKEHYTLQYCFQINDRFKRSNKLPPNQFMGNFQAVPNMALDVKDDIFNQIQVTSEERGLNTGVTGENKDQQRYALPIFTEYVSSLPAIVKAHSSYKLAVIEGITSLTTEVRTSQTAYKLPVSIDFNINDQLFRITNEYICSVKHEKGLEQVQYLVPALGLTYLGSTPFMAYFYNQATRQYYIYQGGNTLQVIDMLERFRDIKAGCYDFITQEVAMPCLATFSRLDRQVKDDDSETDNWIIPVFKHNKINGEVTPPIDTIFNKDFRTLSLPAGLTFQGPNRCIINRYVWSEYMLNDIKRNKSIKWKKVPREEYHPFRDYHTKFTSIVNSIGDQTVKGWTHNPFLLVTSTIGVNEQTDCKFEWEITFAWTVEMERIIDNNEYVTVNVMAETMTPGGKVFSRPTHIFLHKELFARSENYGYYSFRYQSNNGAGNRERLHIWSDGYIAVSSIQLEYKIISEKRNEVLVIQEDIKGMKEM